MSSSAVRCDFTAVPEPVFGLVDRLDFVLPDFTRLSWVSEKAREIWEPRITRINASPFAWLQARFPMS